MNIQQGSLSRYILVVLCIAVVFTTLVLIALNSWVKNRELSGIPAIDQVLSGQTYEDGYKAGFMAAREKFSIKPPMPANIEVKMVNGEIQALSNDSMEVLVTSLDTDPTVDGVSDTRTVAIDKNTKIEKRINLQPEEINKRMADWSQDGAKKGEIPPLPYTLVPVKLSDLKVGMEITISSDESLRLAESFLAKSIMVNEAEIVTVK